MRSARSDSVSSTWGPIEEVFPCGKNSKPLLDVSGTGNTGLGLKLSDGTQVNEQGTVDVTGTGGDYQVGAASVGTWTGYSGDENDLGAASPQLCRLFG